MNQEKIAEKAAQIIIDAIKNSEGVVVLAVPGGRSVKGTFEKLKEADVDWEKVHVFLVDERKVPIDDPESNYQVVKIFTDVLPKGNVHPFEDVSKYKDEIKQYGGKFDIVLLSAGEDGHVASLYPNHPSIQNEAKFYIDVEDSPKPPADRMSATKNLIKSAKTGIILFLGDGKKEAYEKFKDDNIKIEECPAKIVKEIKNYYVFTDIK